MLFEGFGCEVEHTGKVNDGGVDLVVIKNGKRGVVQCKQYTPENKVGSPTVRDLRGTMVRERAALGFLVTTSTFSRQAIEEAAYAPKITLLDVEKLQQLAEQLLPQLQVNREEKEPMNHHQIDFDYRQRGGCLSGFGTMFGSVVGYTTAVVVIIIIGLLIFLACCIFAASILPKQGALILFYGV